MSDDSNVRDGIYEVRVQTIIEDIYEVIADNEEEANKEGIECAKNFILSGSKLIGCKALNIKRICDYDSENDER